MRSRPAARCTSSSPAPTSMATDSSSIHAPIRQPPLAGEPQLHADLEQPKIRLDRTGPARGGCRIGPVKSDLGLFEIGMQLRLTGGKTWHGVAPYVGTGLGLMFDVNSPGDTTGSGYQFGTKLTIAFASGVRWYPARRVMINGDLRAHFWRLKYPLSFHEQRASDGSRVIPLTQPLTDWTLHPWISLGIGWIF